MAKKFEPEKPDELVQRYNSELARVAAKLPMPPDGWRSVVDLGNAQPLLERAIREAWVHGGAHSLAMATPQKIVLQYPTDSPIAEESGRRTVTEISEMSVEDQLRDELRRVRHDLEHVTHERDAAERALKTFRVEVSQRPLLA